MAKTESNMLELGTKAPNFQLIDTVTNKSVSYAKAKGKFGTVIMLICNHCPYVKHLFNVINIVSKEYQNKGINFVAISSNDILNFPEDSPELMKETAITQNFSFPYLYDESQEIAKKYDAACTPDFYLFNNKDLLVYRGQIDESRPGNNLPSNGEDLKNAMDCLLLGTKNYKKQKPSIGCNIKWKE